MVGPPLTEFELTERSGKPFRSADMRGKVWVATYFFTTCPGNCLRLNQNIQLMHNMPELKDVTWVSITCDPDNDTLEALRDYADRWQADPKRWLFCRADLDYTQRVAHGMNLYLEPQGTPGLRDRHRQGGQDPRHVRCHEQERVRAAAHAACAMCSKKNRRRRAWQPASDGAATDLAATATGRRPAARWVTAIMSWQLAVS